jgi:hypothetical protein
MLEYAVTITIIVCALMVMRYYMVRAFQEKYRKSAEIYGDGEQYENTGPNRTQVSAY